MKALAKRCLCPKPTFASIGIKQLLNGSYDNFGWHLNPDDCLHFKVATTECERCGAPLCFDCAQNSDKHLILFYSNHKGEVEINHFLCPTCAEEGQV